MTDQIDTNFVCNVGPGCNIPVYNHPLMEAKRVMVIYKSSDIDHDPGFVFAPYTVRMREPGEKSTGPYLDAPIAKDEVDEILKKRKRDPKDIKAFVCNLTNPDDIEPMIKALDKYFRKEE